MNGNVCTRANQKHFKCDSCEQVFLKKSRLMVHLRTHPGEKPYKCDTCGAQFSEKSTLKRHAHTHIGGNLTNVIPVGHSSHKVVL